MASSDCPPQRGSGTKSNTVAIARRRKVGSSAPRLSQKRMEKEECGSRCYLVVSQNKGTPV